ncbi:protoporphyrinogen oxidase [Actinoallomurus purpureus]|uniref:protoporphyrinogen oxidase n=1 Tax=Actinoallomurus purpureus TaxID=478114 RepID=UPI0020937B9C|nr:protoporphyrinogen oxidase [Actinoallomurus purpureus]MCO6009661.1 protoporphyrinogen oxidase [Actinoallomurus purpureus]
MTDQSHRGHVAVIGGGVAGLTAAHELAKNGARVTLLEGTADVGGKLRVSEIAGVSVDEGAEAMLARRPEGLELVRELGLGDRLAFPGTTSAAIWSRGALHPMPAGQVMGVPADLVALARSQVLSPGGLARVPLDLVRPETPRGEDLSVADFVGARVGREVVDRLVEPLLGGVYAGRVEELSFEATMGGLAVASRSHRSLIAAARSVIEAAPANPGPVFTTLADGMGALPGALAAKVTELGGIVRTEAMVRELSRTPGGWRLTIGPARDPESLEVDAVVIAVPARPTARLLREESPAAAAELGRVEYASMAIVTLAYAVTAFPERPRRSGYLVPAVETRDVKAVTFSSTKWPHLTDGSPGLVVARCSIGRYGDEHALQRSDEELKAAAMTELARTSGVTELPIDARISRWGGGLPQYTVGHLERVARIRAAVAGLPGVAVCGAAYDGVGIPACVLSARTAAARVLEHLNGRGESDRSDEPVGERGGRAG